MKIKINRGSQGTVLVVSLLLSLIIGITVVSCLSLISNQQKMVTRGQAWNAAMPVAEAGVEEAMTQLQYAGGTNNLWTNNWAYGADGMYHKTRTFTNNTYYGVSIQPLAAPVIWSTGYLAAPLSSASGEHLSRLVRVVARKTISTGNGITSKGQITLNGGYLAGVTRNNGTYDTATSDLIPASALTDSTNAGAVQLSGSAHVLGSAYTGPGGTVTTSGGSGVGDTLSQSGIQSGHQFSNANFQFNDVTVPPLGSYLTSFTQVGTTNVAGVAGSSSTYKMSTFLSSDSTKPLIVNGNVILDLTATGNNVLVVSGSGYIDITPGSSLTVYTAGNVTISGGGIVNGTGLADNLTLYGLPTCTSITYSGSADYIGVVNAPEANFTFSGSEKAIGAFEVNTANISGGATVLWDSGLGGNPGWVVLGWNEMPTH